MKIIGSGFGRTGTLSMKAALEQLGFKPCYHMMELPNYRGHIKAWYNLSQGESIDWHKLFAKHEAAVDFPASIFYKELLEAFPDAKVIHTVRDPDRWYASTRDTIYRSYRTQLFPKWSQQLIRMIGQWIGMSDALIWDGLFEGQFDNRERAIEIFHNRTEEVQQVVPAEQLLIFDVKQGWEPLCAFLEVPVPDRPFPHVNDKRAIQRRLTAVRIGLRAGPVVALAVVAAVILAIWG